MDERVLAVTRAVRYWPGKKARQFKFGSFLGKIVVTDRRFLFLSSGGAGWDESIERLMVGGVVGLVVGLATAGYTTNDLDLSALSNEGSLEIQLARIRSCELKQPFILAWVALEYDDGKGGTASAAIVREAVAGKADLAELARVVREAPEVGGAGA